MVLTGPKSLVPYLAVAAMKIAMNAAILVTITLPLTALGQSGGFPAVTDELLRDPAPEDWLMWRRTLNSWGYSPLDQITPANVANLELAWSSPLNPGSVQEGTPLVYMGILYMPHPGDVITANNATTGELLWEYR